MNAATRNALQRRKQAMAASRAAAIVDVPELRAASREKFCELLQTEADAKSDTNESKEAPPAQKGNAGDLAKQIEIELHKMHEAPSGAYKSAYRRLYTSMRRRSEFSARLLSGDLTPKDFVHMSADELKSAPLRESDEALRAEALRNSVGQTLLPENVNYIKDGRDREKWGVSRSAAAIDD